MNFKQMKKKNSWQRVQLIPIACRLDENGRELAPVNHDWVIEEVSTEGVVISTGSGHKIRLGSDHIHSYVTNPERSRTGVLYGFFILNVQVFLQGQNIWVLPNARPGEPVTAQRSVGSPTVKVD